MHLGADGWCFDPSDPAFVDDPYPFYAQLRERDPVHRGRSGAWVLSRYADVSGALGDARLGNAPARHAVLHARNRDRYTCADVAAHILPFLDPPEHAEPRRLLSRAFMERVRTHDIDVGGLADRLLDGWEDHSVRDVVADFASPLAVSVIARLLGVPEDDAPLLERWSESFFYLFTAIPSTSARVELDAALGEFRSYLSHLVEERRRRPESDVVSDLVVQAEVEATLGIHALVDNLMLFFADGVENVDRAIGNAMYALLSHPDQLEVLRTAPESLPSAVDECLRFESPAQHIARVAREAIEIHGVRIPQGGVVLLALGSANRDPRIFPNAERFIVTRRPNPHLSFGRGRHACIGGLLVEREMGAALGALIRRFPRLQLGADPVRFLPRPGHRWVASVPVAVRG